MANGEQIKALLQSHIEGDEPHFYSVAMQVAAREARRGHGRLAEDLRTLIERGKTAVARGGAKQASRSAELAGLIMVSEPSTRLSDMVLSEGLQDQIRRVLREQTHAERILAHGLPIRRKLLLVGPPGTGKTLTASALAGELGLPLFEIRLDGLLTKFMGESAAKLRQVFDATCHARGVYFFDEFDAIGSKRDSTNDVGEIRRILNSFLQMIEQDDSQSVIAAATNQPSILDAALLRRFDDVLRYEIPPVALAADLLQRRLARWMSEDTDWEILARAVPKLSFAELKLACDDAVKDAIIAGWDDVALHTIVRRLRARCEMANQVKDS